MKDHLLLLLAGSLAAITPCRAQETASPGIVLEEEAINNPEASTEEVAPEKSLPIRRWRYQYLFLSATVFDRKTTLLRWWHEGIEHQAYSNINFHEARSANFFEKDGVVYVLFMAIGDENSENLADWNARAAERGLPQRVPRILPDLSQFMTGEHGYVVAGQRGVDEAYAPIDALHQYFSQNRERLIGICRQWEVETKARQEWLKANPPKYEDKPNLDLWFRPGAQKF